MDVRLAAENIRLGQTVNDNVLKRLIVRRRRFRIRIVVFGAHRMHIQVLRLCGRHQRIAHVPPARQVVGVVVGPCQLIVRRVAQVVRRVVEAEKVLIWEHPPPRVAARCVIYHHAFLLVVLRRAVERHTVPAVRVGRGVRKPAARRLAPLRDKYRLRVVEVGSVEHLGGRREQRIHPASLDGVYLVGTLLPLALPSRRFSPKQPCQALREAAGLRHGPCQMVDGVIQILIYQRIHIRLCGRQIRHRVVHILRGRHARGQVDVVVALQQPKVGVRTEHPRLRHGLYRHRVGLVHFVGGGNHHVCITYYGVLLFP